LTVHERRIGPGHTQRIGSLDVFRGFTVAAMILVSTPGTWSAVYTPLDHAAWNGWTPTDLVFPFFLFAMGAAVPIALTRRRGTEAPLPRHVLRRAVVLFALGLLLNAIETSRPIDLATFRIPGVLQRIAIVYVVVAVMTQTLSERAQVALVSAMLVGYWAAMMLVPVPGAGVGVLTPRGNLAAFLDRRIFGPHLLTRDVDPEGFVSTLPAVATAMMGVFAGAWLRRPLPDHRGMWLWVGGAAMTIAGLAWGLVFPINKSLWTSSFALFSAGMAAQCLAVCHWLVDVRGWRALARPFSAFGRNALAAYVLSVGFDSLLSRLSIAGSSIKGMLFRTGFASWLRPCCGMEAASLAYALAYVALWGVVLAEMYRRQIFIGI
jgi:predicted acyltransferase